MKSIVYSIIVFSCFVFVYITLTNFINDIYDKIRDIQEENRIMRTFLIENKQITHETEEVISRLLGNLRKSSNEKSQKENIKSGFDELDLL